MRLVRLEDLIQRLNIFFPRCKVEDFASFGEGALLTPTLFREILIFPRSKEAKRTLKLATRDFYNVKVEKVISKIEAA